MLGGEFSGDTAEEPIEVGGYRSRGLEKAVLEGELLVDTAKGGYRSTGFPGRVFGGSIGVYSGG